MLSEPEPATPIELPKLLDEALPSPPLLPFGDDKGGKQKNTQKLGTPIANLSINDKNEPEAAPRCSAPAETAENNTTVHVVPSLTGQNHHQQEQEQNQASLADHPAENSNVSSKHHLEIENEKNTAFEIRPSPLGGLGAFAARALKKDELILIEPPLLRTTSFDLLRSFRALDDEAKKVYMSLHSRVPFGTNAVENIKQANALIGFGWVSFHIPGRQEIGIYPTASRFNHACTPKRNVKFHIVAGTGDAITLTMAQDAAPGEELLISYGGTPFQLLTTFGFRCGCGGCELRSARDLAVMRGEEEMEWWFVGGASGGGGGGAGGWSEKAGWDEEWCY
ncbi:hypothetical protein B0T19DRAFT_396421 [Cercophora scortea]|uniref:SET domain-containing protein n=1 Tax=Cercophora scortea TaxID=314031 RepID=A0AAE0J4B5_9PEZI|nr:hypothetical protein B0T19DRAFT_396421 [Cercophora scortea]